MHSGRRTIRLSNLDTFYSSGEAGLTLTADGRLEGFNSSSTGAGSESLSTLVSFRGAPLEEALTLTGSVETACELINRVAGENNGKPLPLSLVIKSSISFNNAGETENTIFKISNFPQSFYDAIEPAIGALWFKFGDARMPNPPLSSRESVENITLVEPAVLPVTVMNSSPISNEITEYTSFVPVPQWGEQYHIPIPKPPLFGGNTLELTLHGNGKIKTVKYGKTNGASSLGNAITNVRSGLTETDSEKAAALKEEADVIAQQQRLLSCQTDQESCE